MERWSIKKAAQTYNVQNWGGGLFSINRKGNVCVHPTPTSKYAIDLKSLIDDLIKRKIKPPILLRFMDILQSRIGAINKAFHAAIEANDYPAGYQTFFPIKVNQQRQVVDAITTYGKKHRMGLEVGSKPELVAALSFATGSHVPILCNGYKDTEFIEMVLYATRIGYDITLTIEKMFELDKIVALIEKTGIRPKLGVRVKLSSRGAGKWATSGGEESKFGLTISELLIAIDRLKSVGCIDQMTLLHFHIGSQITKIDKIKSALIEGGRIYAEMRKLGVNLNFVDIGGGLGVDYQGSKSSHFSSANYSVEEYASDVVYQLKAICDDAGVPCPHIISESGRAVVAHYSVLVTNILDSRGDTDHPDFAQVLQRPETLSPPVQKLVDIYQSLKRSSLREDYHDTLQFIQEATSLFNLGYLSLKDRGMAEWLCRQIFEQINTIVGRLKEVPEELRQFQLAFRQTYFANFSLFQSLPDSWAIDQLFPIMPIQRLQHKPEVMASIADITCDSDGMVSSFVGEKGRTDALPLHALDDGEPYYVGFFLIGAYQEILGDMHNLFGDTNAVHVSFNRKASEKPYKIDTVIGGDAIWESLKYVQYKGPEILKHVRDTLEKKVASGAVDFEETSHFLELLDRSLTSYTYLGD